MHLILEASSGVHIRSKLIGLFLNLHLMSALQLLIPLNKYRLFVCAELHFSENFVLNLLNSFLTHLNCHRLRVKSSYSITSISPLLFISLSNKFNSLIFTGIT